MPTGDVVENYTPFGYFSSGGGEGGYTPVVKRAILQYFYRAYGPDSPEYTAAAKRWPKQAHKVEKNPPPFGNVQGGGSSSPGSQPLGYDPFSYGRGMPQPPSRNPALEAKILGGVLEYAPYLYGLGAGGSAAKKLIASLLKRRATLAKAATPKVGKTLDEIFEARAKRTPRKPSETAAQYSERLAKMKTDIPASKVSVKDVPKGKQVGPGGAAKPETRAQRLRRTIAGGGVAGAAATIVQEIIERATGPNAAAPGSTGGGAQPGSGAARAPEPGRNSTSTGSQTVPTGSQTVRPGSVPGTARGGATRVASPTRSSTRVAPSSSPTWLSRLGIPTTLPSVVEFAEKAVLARLLAPRVSSPAPIVFPPLPQPQPQPAPLTSFGPGGVSSRGCECPPKRKRGERKKRTVCYTGRFTETSTGTLKYEKRKRTSCLPSRKKRPLQRAQ